MTHPRIGVCSWSLAARDPHELVEGLQRVGLSAVQLALVPAVTDAPTWGGVVETLESAGMRIASGMLAMAGEDYGTLDSIRRTGGVRPDATWPENRRRAERVADAARDAGIPLVTFHAGFLERRGPVRRAMLDRLGELADLFADRGVRIAFETGQETAETLLGVLDELDRPGIGVNFDPANMILYAMGDPVAALSQLAPRVSQIHVKDAVATGTPGTWGTEVPAGRGEVAWGALLDVAASIEPPVSFIIEREAGAARTTDIESARDLVSRHLASATIG